MPTPHSCLPAERCSILSPFAGNRIAVQRLDEGLAPSPDYIFPVLQCILSPSRNTSKGLAALFLTLLRQILCRIRTSARYVSVAGTGMPLVMNILTCALCEEESGRINPGLVDIKR